MDKEFRDVKAASKSILDRSREVLDESSDEVKDEYNRLEEIRVEWDAKVKEAKANGLPPPSAAGVDTRTANQLKEELETQKAKLDLNLHTNPGVVEQYEKRKRDVCIAFFILISFTAEISSLLLCL